MAGLELPLPPPHPTPHHVSSEYYYSIPVRPLYVSYPVYHPDREPPGYWEGLHQLEPKIAVDFGDLVSKEDWVRAGRMAFLAGDEYSTGSELAFVRDRTGYDAAGVRLTPDGQFPYARYVVPQKGKVALMINSCAACHTRVLEDGSLLLGGPGDFPLGRIIAHELRQAAASLPEGTPSPRVDKTASDYRFAAAPWLEPDPGAYALGMSLTELAAVHAALPPGVFVRQRTSYAHPARMPDLIGIGERRYLDATGLVRQRSIADLMRYAALNEGLDELSSYDGFRPAADDFATLPDPSTLTRRSDEELYALALFLYSLTPPANPHTVDEAAARGGEIFAREKCASCHRPPRYTNERLVPADGFEPPEATDLRILRRRVGTDPGLTMRTRRGTGYYKVPSLRGVWYRGPFFHDGSLASLEDVFDPRRVRDDYVPTGFRGAGVENRSVPGHEFGLELTDPERADLIAFLRTL